jgi:polyhydroxyalkanoate synthesis repressor PhaR
MTQVRTIKRYANRKLYDTSKSCYITLDDIAKIIKEGEEVRIIDNRTKEDLTSITLTQILFEEEKKQKSILPLATLKSIIQSGGEFIQKKITEPVVSLREEAEKTVSKLIKIDGFEETKSMIRDFIDHSQHAIDDLQRRIDDRIRLVLHSMTPFTSYQSDMASLHERLKKLEQRIENLENPSPEQTKN